VELFFQPFPQSLPDQYRRCSEGCFVPGNGSGSLRCGRDRKRGGTTWSEFEAGADPNNKVTVLTLVNCFSHSTTWKGVHSAPAAKLK
jgi:hypothetical protein